MIRRITLVIFLLAMVFFLLPWINVSCGGTQLMSASGLDIVRNHFNVPTVEAEQVGTSNAATYAIYALVASALGIVFSLAGGKATAILRMLAGLAGLAFLVVFKLKVSRDLSFYTTPQESALWTYGVITVNYEIGYWLTLGSFALATVVSMLKFKPAEKAADIPVVPSSINFPENNIKYPWEEEIKKPQ